MEKTFFHQPEKQFLLRRKKFFFKNWPPRFDNSFHQQKTLNKRTLFHLDRKGLYSCCFCWWKPLLELSKIQLLKNIPASGSLFMVEETDFPASGNHFFLHFSDSCQFFPVQQKSIFQQNPSLRLVETKFLANGNRFRFLRVFPLTGNRHLN